MRPDPERISLDLIQRKLAEVSDEELAALVGVDRLLRAAGALTHAPCIGRALTVQADAPGRSRGALVNSRITASLHASGRRR